jgi:hypothetical protein
MGRGPLVGASRDGGSANDLDRYDRESDKTIRRRRDRDRAARRAKTCALVRVLRHLRMARSGHVMPGHRVHVRHDAVVYRAMVMAERLGRREHKRETDEKRA